jgi:hypothetical protein
MGKGAVVRVTCDCVCDVSVRPQCRPPPFVFKILFSAVNEAALRGPGARLPALPANSRKHVFARQTNVQLN